MDSEKKISFYKKFRVWLNKKTSLLLVKRSRNKGYLALEYGILEIALDGIILGAATSYFFNPNIYTLILSFGCGSFILKKIFPSIIKLISSFNLVKVGR